MRHTGCVSSFLGNSYIHLFPYKETHFFGFSQFPSCIAQLCNLVAHPVGNIQQNYLSLCVLASCASDSTAKGYASSWPVRGQFVGAVKRLDSTGNSIVTTTERPCRLLHTSQILARHLCNAQSFRWLQFSMPFPGITLFRRFDSLKISDSIYAHRSEEFSLA